MPRGARRHVDPDRGDQSRPETAPIDVLPTVWFQKQLELELPAGRSRRTPIDPDGCTGPTRTAPGIARPDVSNLRVREFGPTRVLFTENETNRERLYGVPTSAPGSRTPSTLSLIDGDERAVNPHGEGTKTAPLYRMQLRPGNPHSPAAPFRGKHPTSGPDSLGHHGVRRVGDAPATGGGRLLQTLHPASLDAEATPRSSAGVFGTPLVPSVLSLCGGAVARRRPRTAKASRVTSYRGAITTGVICTPGMSCPCPTSGNTPGSPRGISRFMLPLSHVDPDHAKYQIQTLLREWYLHPNGQIPAYEFALGDVNPPVHPWAAWRVYKVSARAVDATGTSSKGLPEAAAQLHLVGQSEGCAGSEPVFRRIPRTRQHRRL